MSSWNLDQIALGKMSQGQRCKGAKCSRVPSHMPLGRDNLQYEEAQCSKRRHFDPFERVRHIFGREKMGNSHQVDRLSFYGGNKPCAHMARYTSRLACGVSLITAR
jgi:hypothetical protein